MTQHVYHRYRDPLDPQLLNSHIAGNGQAEGIIYGFEIIPGLDPTHLTVNPGRLYMKHGECVVEDAMLVNHFGPGTGRLITPNATASDRLDLFVCNFEYVETYPAQPPATYSIIVGTAGSGELPAFSQFQLPIAVGLMEAGQSLYTSILPFPRVWKYNFQVSAGVNKIIHGNSLTARIMVIAQDYSTVYPDFGDVGLRLQFIAPGTLSDGDTIDEADWQGDVLFDPTGMVDLQALMDEIVAARGSMANLNARLSVAMAANGNITELVAARGSQPNLDTRLDQVLEETGLLKAAIAGNGLALTGGNVLSINVDNATLEINSDTLRAKAGGITQQHLAERLLVVDQLSADYNVPPVTVTLIPFDTAIVSAGMADGSFYRSPLITGLYYPMVYSPQYFRVSVVLCLFPVYGVPNWTGGEYAICELVYRQGYANEKRFLLDWKSNQGTGAWATHPITISGSIGLEGYVTNTFGIYLYTSFDCLVGKEASFGPVNTPLSHISIERI